MKIVEKKVPWSLKVRCLDFKTFLWKWFYEYFSQSYISLYFIVFSIDPLLKRAFINNIMHNNGSFFWKYYIDSYYVKGEY